MIMMPKSTDKKESTVYKMLLPTVNRSTCSSLQMIRKMKQINMLQSEDDHDATVYNLQSKDARRV